MHFLTIILYVQKLDLKVKCKLATDNQYGTKTNNTWSGLLGDLAR